MTTGQRGYDRVRNTVIGKTNIKLNYFEEVFTSQHWMMRIYRSVDCVCCVCVCVCVCVLAYMSIHPVAHLVVMVARLRWCHVPLLNSQHLFCTCLLQGP